jgi:hypothetical protein
VGNKILLNNCSAADVAALCACHGQTVGGAIAFHYKNKCLLTAAAAKEVALTNDRLSSTLDQLNFYFLKKKKGEKNR